MGVVDDAQHQALLRCGSQDRQGCNCYQKRLDRGPFLLTECDTQGSGLGVWQPRTQSHHGTQQPVQRSECQRRLCFEALRAENARTTDALSEFLKKRRLADARLTVDHEARGRPVPGLLDQHGEACPLELSAV